MKLNTLIKNSSFILLSLTLAFTACNNNKKQQEDLQQSVIATHDSVMVDMSALMDRKMAVNKLLMHLDSLKSVNTSLDTAEARKDLTQIKTELVSADEEMMTWMHNFNPDYTGKAHEEVMAYLNAQKEKINSVKNSFKNVIIKSDSVIVKYK